MEKRIPIKNHHLEIQLIAKRSMFGLLVMCFLIALLILRLAFLQVYKRDLYFTLSTKNWLDLVPTEAPRGLIYDRYGTLLAENIPVFSLDIIPHQVSNLSASLAALSKIVSLSPDEVNQFKKQLKQHRSSDEIPLKVRLSEKEVAAFIENQHRFPGFFIKARLLRHYPFGERFSHVLGYVGRINTQELNEINTVNYSASPYIGKLGIEKFYEEELHGKVGYQQVENDASGKPIRVLKEIKGIAGKTIYLTIDSGLQAIAQKALSQHKGAIVAIEPATGQILAMVSEPGYDPNAFVLGISQKDYHALQASDKRPLFDRALRGLYPIASTIKPYFALQGLNTGIIHPDDEISDPGWFELANHSHRFRDVAPYGHGKVNLSKAITASCDTYFYLLANKMGIKPMDEILYQFGFGALTGIDLEGELPGIVASPEWKKIAKGSHWYEGDTINSGIGQGFMQATPLQLASAVATLANHGKRFMPYLLLATQASNKTLQYEAPTPLEPVILNDERHWNTVINAMQEVISSPQGTAYRYGHKHKYSIAAKTGTAQIIAKRGDPNKNKADHQEDLAEKFHDHHLFIAFAPVEKPVIALAIITENTYYTIDAARAIFDYYLGKTHHAAALSQAKN
jgi:penicillin-binding protein 2